MKKQNNTNSLLELRGGKFYHVPNTSRGGGVSFNGSNVTSEFLTNLREELISIRNFWLDKNILGKNVLVTVYYNRMIAKSNRIDKILDMSNHYSQVVGVKFNKEKNKHIITYLISLKQLETAIDQLENVAKILANEFDNLMDKVKFKNWKTTHSHLLKNTEKLLGVPKTNFEKILSNASYIEKIGIEKVIKPSEINTSIVTFYNIKNPIESILTSIGVNTKLIKKIDDYTYNLTKENLEKVINKIPFLVSMSTIDINKVSKDVSSQKISNNSIITIKEPTTEPTIGVIDTPFNKNVYFNEWVDYRDELDKNIPRTRDDEIHGTAVSSIIVDGPTFNTDLNDNCGNFKVRHFGVLVGNKVSTTLLMEKIKNIVSNNRDIKVWNLSLGSELEINDNYISYEGATLDWIQQEYDVIFIIAGTNKDYKNQYSNKIGAPADSLNSIVVNSVTRGNEKTDYTRSGPVLSFFVKPDVSYYGGDDKKPIRVCTPNGEDWKNGTSYAAPWIARKVSYLIDVLGFNKETAKALIIHAARRNPKNKNEDHFNKGYGIVPIDINDIVKSKKSDITFTLSAESENWETYTHNIPIPVNEKQYHPFLVTATMVYFVKGKRIQGVDYTSTELNLKFGPINKEEGEGKIKSIDNNNQYKDNQNYEQKKISEQKSRNVFHKWENVKLITDKKIDSTNRPKGVKKKEGKNWGLSIEKANRFEIKKDEKIKFAVVITLSEIDGIDRSIEFINDCSQYWTVKQINVNSQSNVYHKANQDIDFE